MTRLRMMVLGLVAGLAASMMAPAQAVTRGALDETAYVHISYWKSWKAASSVYVVYWVNPGPGGTTSCDLDNQIDASLYFRKAGTTTWRLADRHSTALSCRHKDVLTIPLSKLTRGVNYDVKVTAIDLVTGKTLKPGRVSKVRKSTPWLSPGDAWPVNTSTTWKVRPSSSTAVHREGASITRTRAKYKATAGSAWQVSRSYTKTVKLTGVTVAAYPDGPAECFYSMKNTYGWGPWIPCGDDPEAFDPDA